MLKKRKEEDDMKKIIFRMVVLAVAVMSLSVTTKMFIGIAKYEIQMDNKRFAEENANRTRWTPEYISQYNVAENWIEESSDRTVQACRKYSFLPVLILAVVILLIGVCSAFLMAEVTLTDIYYIRKRYRKRKRRM